MRGTVTVTLGRVARNVIGIGRVKTPTLAIACRRSSNSATVVLVVGYLDVAATARG